MDCSDEEVQALLQSTDFPKLQNLRILHAASGSLPDRVPVWIMRQAGRYLPEFQELRKQHSFFEICQNPKLACETTLLPIRRYNLDAAIIFSDILVVPQALGMTVIMEKDKGPVFPDPLTVENFDKLNWNDALEKLKYVKDAIRLTRHKLNGKVPLLGFAAAPWTLMCYMIEGGGTKTASKAKKWLYANRELSRTLLYNLTDLLVQYIVLQIEGGAQMIQIFESSAEYLTTVLYEEFMIQLLVNIRTNVTRLCEYKKISNVPMVYFAKGGTHLLPLVKRCNFDIIGLDWSADPVEARKLYPDTTLQGNLDPCALYAKKDDLTKYVVKMMRDFGSYRYIVNLGHGIYPDTPTDAVSWFIDMVHAQKP